MIDNYVFKRLADYVKDILIEGPHGGSNWRQRGYRDDVFNFFKQACEVYAISGHDVLDNLREQWADQDISEDGWTIAEDICKAWDEWLFAREKLIGPLSRGRPSVDIENLSDEERENLDTIDQLLVELMEDETVQETGYLRKYLDADEAQAYHGRLRQMYELGGQNVIDRSDLRGGGTYCYLTRYGALHITPPGEVGARWELVFEKR